MYSIEGLKAGIIQAKKNIKTFEDAIERERETIREYYRMIDVIEEKERKIKEAQSNIYIETVLENK